MAINNDLLIEMNEQGEITLVKSIESNRRAFLRFSNRTSRPVDIWWRDFQGIRRHYFRLKPNATYDINSFITHPWEFTDAATKEHYFINNKRTFRAPADIGGMMYRTNWNICVGMNTLRYTCIMAIAQRISCPNKVPELGLPRGLEYELQDLVQKMLDVNEEEVLLIV